MEFQEKAELIKTALNLGHLGYDELTKRIADAAGNLSNIKQKIPFSDRRLGLENADRLLKAYHVENNLLENAFNARLGRVKPIGA